MGSKRHGGVFFHYLGTCGGPRFVVEFCTGGLSISDSSIARARFLFVGWTPTWEIYHCARLVDRISGQRGANYKLNRCCFSCAALAFSIDCVAASGMG